MRLGRIAALSLVISNLFSTVTFGANWRQENGDWYADEVGWIECSDGWYYTDSTGKMLTDTVVDGYYLSITGKMINPTDENEKLANTLLYNPDARVDCSDTKPLLQSFTGKGCRTSITKWITYDGKQSVGFQPEQKESVVSQMKVVNERLANTDGMFNSLPEWDRVRAIYEFVKDTLQYEDGAENLAESLTTGSGVCYHYASLFQLLCERNGIDCDYIEGTAEHIYEVDHSWNRVYIDGEAYLVDCCWDDGTRSEEYFMKKSFDDHFEE